MPRTKLLFLCSRNQWRSPTAEALFKNHARYDARSAGTENGARIKVTACHLGWADLIFCMERKHADRLREKFPEDPADKPVVILRIPDDYPAAHDPALIEHLSTALAPHLPDL
ncbi:MAG: protein tyrosine phosphatase [Opitutaceae bacterium]|nr:protein tyrosine phosphatase [Opitutaceae bacterium]